jgi:DNA-binding MarR family transcriptional regulator
MHSEDVNTRILVRLWDVAEISRRRVEAALYMRADCTLKQFMIMDLVESSFQNLTPTALARRLACSTQNITQVLRDMRKYGWLATPQAYGDKRSSILRMTDAGRAVYGGFARPLVDLAYEQLHTLEDVEKRSLAVTLRKLALARWTPLG